MVRVGLTGGLGSGKSTVSAIFREQGFHVLEADAIAREFMEPGHDVYQRIVEHFGPSVVRADASLDRAHLAKLAFTAARLDELNRIVHPPVIAEQEHRMQQIFARDPRAVVVVESALIFEAEAGGTAANWPRRFDSIVLVTAPDELKVQRFLRRILPPDATPEQRAQAERDARSRLAAQLPDDIKAKRANIIIDNSGLLESTRAQVLAIAAQLRARSES
jgi:dephospho-CoA kinase